jgi:hypothetical protein
MKKFLVALLLLITTAALASPTHEQWTRSAMGRVPVSKNDAKSVERLTIRESQLVEFATEIARVSAKAPLPPRQWAALIITQGSMESNFDTAIVLGNCPKWACDRGRAVGAFQVHDVGPVHDLWSTAAGDPTKQVQMADRMLRRSMTRCAPFAPFPQHVFRAYKGSSCSWAVQREAERVALFNRLVAR